MMSIAGKTVFIVIGAGGSAFTIVPSGAMTPHAAVDAFRCGECWVEERTTAEA